MGFLSKLFEPTEQRNAGDQLLSAVGESWYPSSAGVTITEQGSLRNMTVFACIRIISQSLAAVPLILYERNGRNRTRATTHPLYSVLHDQANSEMTAFEVRETRLAHTALWGNAYSEIEYNANMQVVGLWPLPPDRVGIERNRDTGQLVYTYLQDNGQGYVLPAWRVQHLRYMMIRGVVGISPVRQAMNAIGLAQATEEFGATYFKNGSRPSIILKHPSKLSPEAYARLRDSFSENWQGLKNAHRINILEEGITPEAIGIPPEEAQFLETRNTQIAEIARLYGVPLHMLAIGQSATFASAEQDAINFRQLTLMEWARRDEQALSRDLLTPEESNSYYIEYLLDGLERADIATRSQALNTMRQGGAITANEWRERENMDPLPGGDALLQPLNMGVVGDGNPDDAMSDMPADATPADDMPMEPADASARAAFVPLFEDAARRVIKRIAADVRKGGGSALRKGGPEGFGGWLDAFAVGIGPVVASVLWPTVQAQSLQANGNRLDAQRALDSLAAHMAIMLREQGTEIIAEVTELDADVRLDHLITLIENNDGWLADMAQRAALGQTSETRSP